ncbi:uncharacterized protein DUF2726 [Marinimicrobium koreense]|uniref:Uncharacterized protein DUF2726 n=1 Tax=Marinimicrobium koreense TaxID=306545 RepID=A0A3N1NUI9_9GAMM|nr:DUF2726 domain-containing protein [Marinimicrobium koreense]ROQ19865.1 uncharacterized protein DUF2726 [Marinimicrobium koreense]
MDIVSFFSPFFDFLWWVILLCTAVVIIITLATPKKGRKSPKSPFKYDPKAPWPFTKARLLTDAEKEAFDRLRDALPQHYIFAQVQLSQMMDVKPGHDFRQWFNRISRMSADFVVVSSDLDTVAAIEIDDTTHRDPKRMEADSKKAKALKAAGIKLVRWDARRVPKPEVIRQEVLGVVQKAVNPVSHTEIESVEVVP